ncbi:hypothetical protein BDZ45DRAFT_793671 [Acephala macrosclerotiorum]|nr:hypothetical protein BDZ45DRAFT_793671 [Acephala macrosclerotiorum]
MTSSPSTMVTIQEIKDWLREKIAQKRVMHKDVDKWVDLDFLEDILKRIRACINNHAPYPTKAATLFHALLMAHRYIYGDEANANFVTQIPDQSCMNLLTVEQFLTSLRHNETVRWHSETNWQSQPKSLPSAKPMAQSSSTKEGHAKTDIDKNSQNVESEAAKIVAELRGRIETDLRSKLEAEIRERIEAELTESLTKKLKIEIEKDVDGRVRDRIQKHPEVVVACLQGRLDHELGLT